MSVNEREHEQVQVGVDPVREGRARLLEAAALEIEVRGWTQGWTCNTDGEVCAMGAVLAALGDSVAGPRLGIGVDWDRVDAVYGKEAAEIVAFNDNSVATAADVTFVLRWRAQEIRDGR